MSLQGGEASRSRRRRAALGPAAACLALALALTLLAAGLARAEDGLTDTDIALGMTAPFRGDFAYRGLEAWRGALVAFEAANAAGGMHGRKVALACLDDGADGEVALANTIAMDQDIFGLFGTVGTDCVLKSLPVLRRDAHKGIFLFSDLSGAQPQREPSASRFVFNVRPSDRDEAEALAALLVDRMGFRRVGLLVQEGASGRSLADAARRALASRGLSPCATARLDAEVPASGALGDQLTALRGGGSQAVLALGDPAACAAFLVAARKGSWMVPVGVPSAADADALLSLLLDLGKATGLTLTAGVVASEAVPCWCDTGLPLVRDYRKAMDAAKHLPDLPNKNWDLGHLKPRPYSFAGLEGFLDARLFCAILAQAPADLTRKAFIATAAATGPLEVGLPEQASFAGGRPQALDQVYLVDVKQDAWAPLKGPEDLLDAGSGAGAADGTKKP